MSVAQSDFIAGVLDPERPAPQGLVDGQGRAAGKRFDVYRNNVASSLTDALEQAFPVILKLVGTDFFRALAGVYLRAHPPSSPLIMHYGAEMPGFLEQFPPVQTLPYLPDIARLEGAIRTAYHAADATPVPATALGEIDPERLGDVILRFAPATQIITSPFPIHGIWRANSEPGAPPPTSEAQSVLITRPDMDPSVTLIPAPALPVLNALLAGTALGPAFDLGGEGFDPAALLGQLLGQGAITDLILPS